MYKSEFLKKGKIENKGTISTLKNREQSRL